MRDKYILAVDLGTSGPKVALVSLQGEIVASTFRPVSLTLLPEGGAEQDPEEWWQAVLQGARELIGRGVVPTDRIAAISCTAQWSGTVPVDRDGNALGKAIIWMDSRGAAYVRQATSGPVRLSGYGIHKLFTWLRLTAGIPGHSGKDSVAHILYLKHNNPRLYEQTWKFLEPKDYLNLRFTGEAAASYDSIALHWVTDNRNIAAVRYHPKLLALAGLERDRLPDLKRAVDILGPLKQDVARELGLKQNTPVVVGTPDVQSAALGSGAVRDYAGHLYIGTSSWLSCHVPFKKTDLLHNMASLPSAIPRRYFVANEQETAGACLTYLKDRLFFPRDELTPN
ncbi:MAG: xylulose kinase, partial [Calditrichaeota bacterium]